jgi:hypothetical protein
VTPRRPLWVKSGHSGRSSPCPLYTQKRTLPDDSWSANIINTAFDAHDKILQVFWTGAKYAVTDKLDVIGRIVDGGTANARRAALRYSSRRFIRKPPLPNYRAG